MPNSGVRALTADALADVPRIRVVVRKRPLNRKELATAQEDIVTIARPSGEAAAAGQLVVWEPRTKAWLLSSKRRRSSELIVWSCPLCHMYGTINS